MASTIINYFLSFLTLVGAIFLVIAYRSWNSTDKIIKNGVKTEGVVVKLLQGKSNRGGATGTKAPAVQFKTQKGEIITYNSTTYTSPCPYQEGQVVPIWYMPDNPQEVTLKGADAYLLPLIFAGFGALAFLFGLPTVFSFFIRLIFQ